MAAGTCFKETSANHSADRSGDSGERRKHLKTEECGFLPKAATLVLQRSLKGSKIGFVFGRCIFRKHGLSG